MHTIQFVNRPALPQAVREVVCSLGGHDLTMSTLVNLFSSFPRLSLLSSHTLPNRSTSLLFTHRPRSLTFPPSLAHTIPNLQNDASLPWAGTSPAATTAWPRVPQYRPYAARASITPGSTIGSARARTAPAIRRTLIRVTKPTESPRARRRNSADRARTTSTLPHPNGNACRAALARRRTKTLHHTRYVLSY